jgi:DNA gyrase/topoisomerase IV subunit B
VSAGKIADNEEITNIKDLRSENNKRYTVDELRRKVMVLADQDVDGSSRG